MVITQSTRIIDEWCRTDRASRTGTGWQRGIPGSYEVFPPAIAPGERAALITGKRKESTGQENKLNSALREYNRAVRYPAFDIVRSAFDQPALGRSELRIRNRC